MLEALIVYPITLFLLFFILCLFSILFQRWNMQVIANETAMRIAQTYKLTEADVMTGEITADEIVEVKPFRYFLGNKEELKNSAAQKATQYATTRLLATTYTKFVDGPKIDVNVVSDALARRHIEVTVKGTYSVPFGEALSYFGFGSTIEYETKGYADCIDLIDYINTTKYISTQSKKLTDNSFGKLVDSLLSLFDNILN